MTAYLDVRTALTTVQDALVRTIQLAYGVRLPPAASAAALRALPTTGTPPRALRYVAAESCVYRLEPFSSAAHSPPAVVKPADRTGLGAWIKQSSTVTLGPHYQRPLHTVSSGYLRTVALYEGQSDEEVERFFAQTPSVLVESDMDEVALSGQVQGGIYKVSWPFWLHVFSRNFRDGPEAIQGSLVTSEAAADPGLNRIIGDLRYLLAGCRLDLDPGVKFCTIDGKASLQRVDLQQREFKGQIPLMVMGSFHITDEDLTTIAAIYVTPQHVGTGEAETYDADNCVTSGCRVIPQPGLTATPTAGTARVGGAAVSSTPASHTFNANSDTYRDLAPDGSLTYTAVAVDGDPPAQAAGTLRVGFTRTDGANIVQDVLLCAHVVPTGDTFQAL